MGDAAILLDLAVGRNWKGLEERNLISLRETVSEGFEELEKMLGAGEKEAGDLCKES